MVSSTLNYSSFFCFKHHCFAKNTKRQCKRMMVTENKQSNKNSPFFNKCLLSVLFW